MTKRVLVAVDGTEASHNALEIACALADNYEANLGLLCVVEPGQISEDLIEGAIHEGYLERPDYNAWYATATADQTGFVAVNEGYQRAIYVSRLATAIADKIVAEAEAYSKDSAVKAVKTFVRSGDVAEEILDVAKSNGADLIVMGHDQQGVLDHLIKGSVAEKVEREAPCPVLVYCLPKQG